MYLSDVPVQPSKRVLRQLADDLHKLGNPKLIEYSIGSSERCWLFYEASGRRRFSYDSYCLIDYGAVVLVFR